MKKTFLIFFGPPGSGKGTQVDMIASKLKLPVICPGELFRHEIEINSDIGKKVKRVVETGKLVSEEITEKLVNNRLEKNDAQKGAIFDGFPRRKKQLDFLINRFKNITDNEDRVYAILVDVSNKEVSSRLGGRRVCDCGAAYHLKYNPPEEDEICDLCSKKLYIRTDDKPKVIDDRLKLYHRQTKPLLDYWQNIDKLIKIDGEQTIEKVQKDIIHELNQRNIFYDNNKN